jgi:hypothetical protein
MDNKVTATQTGTLFYTKLQEGGSFRVRFRSFNHIQLENRERQAELEQIQSDYKFFKYALSKTGTGSRKAGRAVTASRRHCCRPS